MDRFRKTPVNGVNVVQIRVGAMVKISKAPQIDQLKASKWLSSVFNSMSEANSRSRFARQAGRHGGFVSERSRSSSGQYVLSGLTAPVRRPTRTSDSLS